MRSREVDETLMGALMAGVPVPLQWVLDARRDLRKFDARKSNKQRKLARSRAEIISGTIADDIKMAQKDWLEGVAYFCQNQYRYRTDNTITPWNKTAKAVYKNSKDLDAAARNWEQGVDGVPRMRYHYPSAIERSRKSGNWQP